MVSVKSFFFWPIKKIKSSYSDCNGLRQILGGTDTCQGRRLRVHGSRSHTPPSTPVTSYQVDQDYFSLSISVELNQMCVWLSPGSSEAQGQHCVRLRRRCRPTQTNGLPPWRNLAGGEPVSEKDILNIESTAPSFFIWKCETGFHGLMNSVFKSFQTW